MITAIKRIGICTKSIDQACPTLGTRTETHTHTHTHAHTHTHTHTRSSRHVELEQWGLCRKSARCCRASEGIQGFLAHASLCVQYVCTHARRYVCTNVFENAGIQVALFLGGKIEYYSTYGHSGDGCGAGGCSRIESGAEGSPAQGEVQVEEIVCACVCMHVCVCANALQRRRAPAREKHGRQRC